MDSFTNVDSFTEQVDDDEKLKTCLSKRQGRQSFNDIPKIIDSKVGKVKRYTWSSASIELFFEGLLQHGKDFPKILEHMQRKSTSCMNSGLTKDQVRFFFYRTWRKVELLLLDLSSEKKTKANHTAESSNLQVDDIDIVYEDTSDVQLDSSLDEMEDIVNVEVSPKREFDNGSKDADSTLKSCIEPDNAFERSPDVPSSLRNDGRRKDFIFINGAHQSLDLVALICYWKLKQKYPIGEHSFSRKLSELVYYGSTTIPGRVKGKRRSQIKIPSCGALRTCAEKHVVSSEESQVYFSDPNPTTDAISAADTTCCSSSVVVVVELTPLNTTTWIKVQARSLNPRIRLRIEVSKTLLDILLFLKDKFSVQDPDHLSLHVKSFLLHQPLNLQHCNCSGLFSSSDFDCKGIPLQLIIEDLLLKLECGKHLQLFYKFDNEEKINWSPLSKTIKFLRNGTLYSQSNPDKKQSLSNVTEYRNMLPTLHIRKSPLSKYRKLKYRSPIKSSTSKLDIATTPRVLHQPLFKPQRKKTSLSSTHTRHLVPKPLPFLAESQSKDANFSLSDSKSPTNNTRLEDDIKGAVVQNYLKVKGDDNDKSTPIYSSSDTVNELLQGLVSDDDVAIKNLANETSEFLPTFSRALKPPEPDMKLISPVKDELVDQCSSVFEDASTDYISKFRELASKMENQ